MKKRYFYSRIIFVLMICFFNSVCNSQSKSKYEASEGFVAHEWGTFTTLSQSNGNLLSGLEVEEEHLPSFVHDLCFCPTFRTKTPSFWKGRPPTIGNATLVTSGLQNVFVKMETPVLYFYSSENTAKDISVDVKFKNGSISQWYPMRSEGEFYDGTFYLTALDYYAQAPPITPELVNIDFSKPREGWINWQVSVLPLNTSLKYTNNTLLETPVWVSPRATASNLIKTKDPDGQVEKFLFYRGIASFNPPLRVEFNTKHNLVITNSEKDPITYVMVYEKRADGKTVIWWSGNIAGEKKMVVVKPTNEGSIDAGKEMENFVLHLVNAGLYEDEARAMLNTWKKSYFEHEGLKVFWIVPDAFTNAILPLKIIPVPSSVKRVLVGRSEILTPGFEKQLANMGPSEFINKYKDDRFLLAYRQSNGLLPSKWTDYNEGVSSDDMTPDENTEIEVFPSPTMRKLTVKLYNAATIKIFATNGVLVNLFEDAVAGENVIDIEILPEGIYLVKVEFGNGKFNSKKIIKK